MTTCGDRDCLDVRSQGCFTRFDMQLFTTVNAHTPDDRAKGGPGR